MTRDDVDSDGPAPVNKNGLEVNVSSSITSNSSLEGEDKDKFIKLNSNGPISSRVTENEFGAFNEPSFGSPRSDPLCHQSKWLGRGQSGRTGFTQVSSTENASFLMLTMTLKFEAAIPTWVSGHLPLLGTMYPHVRLQLPSSIPKVSTGIVFGSQFRSGSFHLMYLLDLCLNLYFLQLKSYADSILSSKKQ